MFSPALCENNRARWLYYTYETPLRITVTYIIGLTFWHGAIVLKKLTSAPEHRTSNELCTSCRAYFANFCNCRSQSPVDRAAISPMHLPKALNRHNVRAQLEEYHEGEGGAVVSLSMLYLLSHT
jgi:hypothetical protein